MCYRPLTISDMSEAQTTAAAASGLAIGSTVSIAEVTSQLERAETAVFQKNAEHIKRVASVLILSVAS